ncbi:MAG: Hsp70 family protein [Pseudomonadota bacterium]
MSNARYSGVQASGVLGIDFGTSNSAAGIALAGVPHLVRVEGGETTLPTSVFYDAETKSVMFGRAANRSLIAHDDGRFMGRSKAFWAHPLCTSRAISMASASPLLM